SSPENYKNRENDRLGGVYWGYPALKMSAWQGCGDSYIIEGICNVSPNGVFGNKVYGGDSEGFGVNPLSDEFRLCNIDEWRSINGGGLLRIHGYSGGGDMVIRDGLKGFLGSSDPKILTNPSSSPMISMIGICNVSPNEVFGNEVYGGDSEGFGVNPSSDEFRLCNSNEWRSINGDGPLEIRGYGGGGDMVTRDGLKGCFRSSDPKILTNPSSSPMISMILCVGVAKFVNLMLQTESAAYILFCASYLGSFEKKMGATASLYNPHVIAPPNILGLLSRLDPDVVTKILTPSLVRSDVVTRNCDAVSSQCHPSAKNAKRNNKVHKLGIFACFRGLNDPEKVYKMTPHQQTSASIPMVAEMHKEDLQAAIIQMSLGGTGEEGANPLLSSVESTSHQEPVFSPFTIVHSEFASGHDASADFIAEVDPGKSYPKDSLSKQQGWILIRIIKAPEGDDDDDEIRLEDLTKKIKYTSADAMDLDSLKDDPSLLILSEDKEENQTETHAKTEDTLHMEKLKIKVPCDLKVISGKLEKFRSSISVLTSKVTTLENIKLDLLVGLLALPERVSLINDKLSKLKVLDALPSLLNKVAEALDRFENRCLFI
nr:hypothetical protein [Tanacetum cinerariifolium]